MHYVDKTRAIHKLSNILLFIWCKSWRDLLEIIFDLLECVFQIEVRFSTLCFGRKIVNSDKYE